MKQVKRSELYALVCASPLSKLAAELGTNGTKLAAICREHQIPYPGSGYWTRISLRLDAKLPPLPVLDGADDPLISIHAHTPRKRADRADEPVPATPDNHEGGEASPDRQHAGQSLASTQIPLVKDKLVKPHKLIAGWIADHERRQREARANRDRWGYGTSPEPYTDLDRRRFRILDALFRGLEARGGKVSERDHRQLCVAIDQQEIEFQVREKARQVKTTRGEGRSAYTRTALVGTGKLTLAIKTYLRGGHNEEWLETDKKPLEAQLPAIIDRFFEGAVILKDWADERERERQQFEVERKRRAELQRMAEEDEKRQARLAELAAHWQTANVMRAFINAVKEVPYDASAMIEDRSVADWLAWADAAVDRLDVTAKGPEGLFQLLAAIKAQCAYW